ncbi:MAG: DUF11 domain-containing protein, partial [Bacteroidetes bacterium]|nr:DUF11 domain-containing protein [Bacteroidota bacterium]
NGGVNNSGTVNWNIGTIPGNGGSASIQLTLQVRPDLPNGTNLTNTIGVTYTVGGNTFTITSNSPYAAVGVIRGFSISPTTLSAAEETDDTLAYAFTIFNTGNSSDIGELSYSSTRGYSWTFFKDVNNNSILDNGDTQLHDTQGSLTGIDIDTLAAADSIKILARLIVPVVSSDQIQDVTTFTVKSNADQSKFQSAVGTTTIGKAVLSVVRSVTPSGNRPPGDEMTFTVTYQNVGHGKAYNVVLTETEPDSMSYVANSVTINNIAKTDAADGDEVTVTTNDGRKVITINVGTLNSLSTEATIKYRATIH